MTKVVGDKSISSMCSVLVYTIVVRLKDGSYQDYGKELNKNLGIYKCTSCQLVYSVGQCGYPDELAKCPNKGCDATIGGENHESHKSQAHIKTLSDLKELIVNVFKQRDQDKYTFHKDLSLDSMTLLAFKVAEV